MEERKVRREEEVVMSMDEYLQAHEFNVEASSQAPLRCPECGSTKFIYSYERGEITCAVCGYVVTDKVIDQGPEWRAFTPEEREKRSRVGAPLTRATPDNLTTVVDWRGKDALGRELDYRRRMDMMRLSKWQKRSRIQTSLERNLQQANMELERIASQLELTKPVKERAMEIYRRAVESGLVRGRSIESVMAAAIYAACRELKIPRTLDEIAKFTKGGKKDVARCYRLLLREGCIKVPLADPVDFVPRIAEALKLRGKTIMKAIEILNKAKERGLTAGKDPAGLAAAAIYIASLLDNDIRTQKEVAQAAQVTEVTVRNRYKELAKELKIKLPIR
ncbi:MAG: transcription initiation factor IIB [Thermoprotei archaeon]|nr:MAG: transcription initiation factor IIB [Thermoprotei archaeon]RLF25689.1 MAG: transcription initiation factor IIB [Thermoprotei archaeon]